VKFMRTLKSFSSIDCDILVSTTSMRLRFFYSASEHHAALRHFQPHLSRPAPVITHADIHVGRCLVTILLILSDHFSGLELQVSEAKLR
jgi:hypothetical protein